MEIIAPSLKSRPYSSSIVDWPTACRDRSVLRDIVASQNGRVSLLIHPGNLVGKVWGERSPLNPNPFSADMNLYLERIRRAVSAETGVCFILGGNHPIIGKHFNTSDVEPMIRDLMRKHYNRRLPHTYLIYSHHASRLTGEELDKRADLMVEAVIVDIPSVTNEGMPDMPESGLAHFRSPSRWGPVIDLFRQIGVTRIEGFGGEEVTYDDYRPDGEKRIMEKLGDGMGCPGAALFSLRDHFPIKVYPQFCYGIFNQHLSPDAPLDRDSYDTGIPA